MAKPLQLSPQEIELLRVHAFKPCNSKQELKNWIYLYLGFDLPDGNVDPRSTSNPIDFLWELYSVCKAGGSTDYAQILLFASRDSFKTLSASIFEVLCLVHLTRDVIHGAAIKPQSKRASSYCQKMLNAPFFREFVSSKNDSTLEITRYEHKVSKDNFTSKQYALLSPTEKDEYDEIKQSVVIVVATVQSMNGQHGSLVLDECDIIQNKEAYEESKFIPSEINGLLPFTLLTSTRKYSFGIVQKEIDEAPNTGMIIRSWNILDVTKRCGPERHLPQLPEIPIYVNDDLLKAVSEEDFKNLTIEEQKKYNMQMGSQGCLSNCKLFAACKGRLKNQTSDSSMLKSINHTQATFKKSRLDKAKAQLLCLKPSTEGLIYNHFDKNVHMISAGKMASMITGGEEFPETFTRQDLKALVKRLDLKYYGGMDFGTVHNFATVVGFKHDERLFVTEAREIPDLDPSEQVDACMADLDLDIFYYPDMAMTGTIKMFKKAGFHMVQWKKKPGSVLEGIGSVKEVMTPVGGTAPKFYILKDGPGCELLGTRLSQYHWSMGPDGKSTEVPDDEDDDLADASRYLIMNVMKTNRAPNFVYDAPTTSTTVAGANAGYLSPLIQEALGYTPTDFPETLNSTYEKTSKIDGNQPKLVKKRGFRMY